MGSTLPRTPAVFERKLRWRKYEELNTADGEPQSQKNYKSAAVLEDIIRSQFEEEEKEHMMRQHTVAEAVVAYGQKAVTAALGADLKPGGSARVLHDGTHGVGKNPQVVPRDQARNPGPGEAKVVMAHESRRGSCTLGLTADVRKAHRRYRVAPEDWQHQLCRLGDTVWANEVGTFGMGSASYWWARLFGGAGRLVLYTLMHHPFWQLIYADDTMWTASGPKAITHLVLALFIYTLMGFPWSWGKCRGGPTLEWVGYWMDYSKFAVGISESRARWLVDWADRVLAANTMYMPNLAAVLGRWVYACGALDAYRPFLGPLFAWAASAPETATLPIPAAAAFILQYLADRLRAGDRISPCTAEEGMPIECFRADATASNEVVAIGGWECAGCTPPEQARWFAIRLTRETHPWVWEDGEPFRHIAGLELLATLHCVEAFGDGCGEGRPMLTLSGTTDNKGNSHVVSRLLTTTFPLSAVLMQLSHTLFRKGRALHLQWAPRDQNTEADELANMTVHRFNPDKRLYPKPDLKIMDTMLKHGTALYARVKEARVSRQLKRIAKTNAQHFKKEDKKEKKRPKPRALALRARDPWG